MPTLEQVFHPEGPDGLEVTAPSGLRRPAAAG